MIHLAALIVSTYIVVTVAFVALPWIIVGSVALLVIWVVGNFIIHSTFAEWGILSLVLLEVAVVGAIGIVLCLAIERAQRFITAKLRAGALGTNKR